MFLAYKSVLTRPPGCLQPKNFAELDRLIALGPTLQELVAGLMDGTITTEVKQVPLPWLRPAHRTAALSSTLPSGTDVLAGAANGSMQLPKPHNLGAMDADAGVERCQPDAPAVVAANERADASDERVSNPGPPTSPALSGFPVPPMVPEGAANVSPTSPADSRVRFVMLRQMILPQTFRRK